MSKKNKIILVAILMFLAILSLCTIFYPFISNLQVEKQKKAIVLNYQEAVQREHAGAEAITAAHAYNMALANGTLPPSDYDTLLNPNKTGMMGLVVIPAIGIELPIYHGTQSLDLGAVHLQGTSLPVGGDSSHCVISAHSGMAAQKMFSDLDQLAIGDIFYLSVCGEKIAYEVDQILSVLPEETTPLRIVHGMDYCTLLTCTPYGVNTHRLLVRGHRVDISGTVVTDIEISQKPSTWTKEYLKGLLYGICFVAFLTSLVSSLLWVRKRREDKCTQKH